MKTITVFKGDGIGPEIMDATLFVLDKLGAGLSYEFADAGLAALEAEAAENVEKIYIRMGDDELL